jgi:lantibiotic biosynthesis protein
MSFPGHGATWQPVLSGEMAARALETVRAIAAELAELNGSKIDEPSLAGGSAGLALLYSYCGQAEPGDDDEQIAVECLSRAIEAVGAMDLGPSLYGGFTGVAWVIQHLRDRLFEADDEDPNCAIDEALLNYLSRSPWEDDYDLIVGLAGIGVYALERLPSVSAVTCLEKIVERLDETAERSIDGLTWLTRPDLLPEHQRAVFLNGYYNLGLAHGVPGIIALLGQVCAAGVAIEKARPLLDGAVAWLLQQRLGNGAESCFPPWVGPDVERDDCRLAWCYGDGGVSAALLLAARCVNEADWEREAIEIARRAATRKPESADVKDAGLCHGAAGLGHIFNRLFQATGEEDFRDAARFWFEHTLDFRRAGEGLGGFLAYHITADSDELSWEAEPGVLEGAAGIGLALLAASTPIEPAWDRMLLLSSAII